MLLPSGKEESDPTYSYNHIQYFISKIIYKLPFVLSINLISMSEIFKLLSSDTILRKSLPFFILKETYPRKFSNFKADSAKPKPLHFSTGNHHHFLFPFCVLYTYVSNVIFYPKL